ncbi:glycoside hydrolase family 3 C-terminal domain-containing protein [Halosimplex rubrum]|uniref:Glycoside hydrolase family 3 C-terminal domain-containing protein n=1 Tax=Halosimplex rubrum TaxID=869889 RepID=A0A7D5TN10_9EURY|nr:glycoside hydrolase family 3 C-terminal domain-containing protein [Halosimplex rubrum]QLH76994.1 glycoside hydrolase family 3 C-terminal domain-containing protein [Halosimplex rubrum]
MTDARIDALVSDLTLDEKLRLVRGRADPEGRATGYLPGVERLDVPPLRLVDGPLGVRDREATAFPATVALGAAWDPDLARRLGRALADETRTRGHDVLLAPGLNLVRVPTGGRNFEYLSEDPELTSALGAAYVDGVETGGVGATAKHFVANNQEHRRDTVDAVVSERALREIYLPGFRAAVDAGASAVMAAYNRVNGHYMSEHRDLLEGVLRDEWDFDGAVMSDWWGTHDAVAAAEGGLDLEMPGASVVELFAPRSRALRAMLRLRPSDRLGIDPPLVSRLVDRFADDGQPDPYPFDFFGEPLKRAVADGLVAEATIDRKVRRVLGLYDRFGMLDGGRSPGAEGVGGARGPGDSPSSVDWDDHHDLAREVARRGTVLLADDGVLPLDGDESLAVVGPNADEAKVGGGGSSEVTPTRTVSPVEGLRSRAPRVAFERGVKPVANPSMFDVPGSGLRRRLRTGPDFEAAVEAAAAADVAVVVVQDGATEGEDRDSMALPGNQDRLVRAVAEANPRTVVLCRSSGPVEMPWADDVAAVVQTWYPGQADGAALADVLYGADPGGRLPMTVGRRFDDYPVAGDERRYPGVDEHVHYDEGVFVGYRGFDRDGVAPRFPFGHGLSYADFGYDDLAVERVRTGGAVDDLDAPGLDAPGLDATVTVENRADRPGREVVQAYVEPPAAPAGVARPRRELAGFESIALDGGERRTVSLSVPRRALARYDRRDGWTVDAGEYGVVVGRSSREERVRATVDLS